MRYAPYGPRTEDQMLHQPRGEIFANPDTSPETVFASALRYIDGGLSLHPRQGVLHGPQVGFPFADLPGKPPVLMRAALSIPAFQGRLSTSPCRFFWEKLALGQEREERPLSHRPRFVGPLRENRYGLLRLLRGEPVLDKVRFGVGAHCPFEGL